MLRITTTRPCSTPHGGRSCGARSWPRIPSVSGRQREALMFSKDNLMSLCHDCHVAVHATLGKQTREENAKRKDDAMRKFCERYGLNDND